jgi:hypothetical protein
MASLAAKPKYDPFIQCRQRYAAVLREAFRQQPFLSVTDWAAENRYLTGSESGRYNLFVARICVRFRIASTI